MNSRSGSAKKPSWLTVSAPVPASPPSGYSPSDPVAPVAFQSFPTVDEILEHNTGGAPHPLLQLGTAPPRPSPSLFQGLLGGRLDVLMQDALEHPERYEDTTREALAALGTKKPEDLGPEEHAVLDRATLDFATYRPPAPTPAPKLLAPKKTRLLDFDDALEDGRAPQVEEPGGALTPYWWRN